MGDFNRFFQSIDHEWPGPRDGRIPLRVLGSAALMLQSDYKRGTNDGDVLETQRVTGSTKVHLLALAEKDTPLALRHGIVSAARSASLS